MPKSDFSNILKMEKKKKPQSKNALRKAYKVPKWFKSLPLGSHGNTPSQKKAWKVVSDYVRQRDFCKYGPYCADQCGQVIFDWKNTDAGHYKAWSVCHGLFKYQLKNLLMQSSNCNRRSDGPTGLGLSETLKARYGKDILQWIETENEKYRGKKIEEWELVEMVAKLAPHLVK